ncbi:MAG: hypothetical protein MJY87_02430 [Fibrobacter sp.]|nr:hypothetical protein [Fibrobacter sp.]
MEDDEIMLSEEAVAEEVAEMSESELREFNDQMVAEVRDFIDRNIERNSRQVKRMRADRAFASGDQWDKNDRQNRTEDRLELAIPMCQNVISAVTNPIAARPFRCIVEPRPKFKDAFAEGFANLNARLREIQDDYETKAANNQATVDEATTGLGFTYATTVERDGTTEVVYRAMEDATMVIWDADCKSVTMEDAKQAVVVELIKESEAEDRFGSDIWGGNRPERTTLADLGSNFAVPEGLVPLITYFRVEGRSCEFHRLIGEMVVESDLVEGLSRVPIIAFVGEKTWFDKEIGYSGLIHRLRPMQKLANYANSQMVERLAMCPKTAWTGPDEAIDGYEDEWTNANFSTNAYLSRHQYNQEGKALDKPELVQIGAKVDDLQSVINGAVQQMQFATGVAVTGIVDQAIQDDATATEVLMRTKSSQSNVSHYLEHTKESIKASGKVLAEMCIAVYEINVPPGSYDIKLEGGCVELTQMEEDRRSLLAMMQFAPEVMKGVISIGIMNTLDIPQAPKMAEMMFKQLPPEVQNAALGQDGAQQVATLQRQNQELQGQVQQLNQQLQQVSIENQQLQLRSKADVAVKQIDAQTQLQKQQMVNENAILLKRMELQAGAQQAQFEAQVEGAAQSQKIVADANEAAAKAERDLNGELVKAEQKARLEMEQEARKREAESVGRAAEVAAAQLAASQMEPPAI